MARLGTRQGHARARALLRDARWDLPGAVEVPVFGAPAPFAVAGELIAIRLRRAARLIALRWAGASLGGGLAGAVAGAVGGLMLAAAPGSSAPVAVSPVLTVIGGGCGAVAGAGVGAGLCLAEASVRSQRSLALIGGAALVSLAVFLIIYNNKKEKERTRALQQLAGTLRWSFAPLAPLNMIGGLERFTLFSQGHSKEIKNFMYGEAQGVKAAVLASAPGAEADLADADRG
jgi:hypothetical protein